ncbi:MAG: TlyA family RNA methyltransferase [Actinomycetota bacterium]|nr:TlyA family RNA methyltransferase [Actinomycetota bacterium]
MPPRRLRLDAELVRRGLARSREHASGLISAGRVIVNGSVATKPATAITTNSPVVVRPATDQPDFVGRGAHKLAGALAAFGPQGFAVSGRRCLDAGASTGGFTDVLLRAGATYVAAVDVGYGQLAWSLRSDPRVEVHDRTNVRELTVEQLGGPVDVVVGDLSFISLELVLDALVSVTNTDGDMALMVKPQFEVGKERIGKRGVVRDVATREEAVERVAKAAEVRGWGARAVVASPLPGPAGNVEFFLWLRRGTTTLASGDIQRVVSDAQTTGARRDGDAGVADERLEK